VPACICLAQYTTDFSSIQQSIKAIPPHFPAKTLPEPVI
jgi:hypothetical protein